LQRLQNLSLPNMRSFQFSFTPLTTCVSLDRPDILNFVLDQRRVEAEKLRGLARQLLPLVRRKQREREQLNRLKSHKTKDLVRFPPHCFQDF